MRRLMALCNMMLALTLCQYAAAAALPDVIRSYSPRHCGSGTSYPRVSQSVGNVRTDCWELDSLWPMVT